MAGVSCAWQTAAVWFASRSARVSPMQKMTESPLSSATRVFSAMSSELSWKIVRRSEWPFRGDDQRGIMVQDERGAHRG